jgi:hypothetical protein
MFSGKALSRSTVSGGSAPIVGMWLLLVGVGDYGKKSLGRNFGKVAFVLGAVW